MLSSKQKQELYSDEPLLSRWNNAHQCNNNIATHGENKEQQECVFAWTVLLRNVTLVHESQKGIMGELQQRNGGQICVPAPTWTRQNCNISVNKH